MASITVPPLGESIVEATVSRWLKKEGDSVALGDTLVELETDKITVEVSAQEAGTLSTRMHKEGDVVHVGDSLGEIGAGGGSGATGGAGAQGSQGAEPAAPSAGVPPAAAAASAAPAPSGPIATAGSATASAQAQPASPSAGAMPSAPPSAPPSATQASVPAANAASAAASASAGSDAQRVSPAAGRLAAESGVDLTGVQGSGRGGVVSKPDVVAAMGAGGYGAGPYQSPAAQESGQGAPAQGGATQSPQSPQSGQSGQSAQSGQGTQQPLAAPSAQSSQQPPSPAAQPGSAAQSAARPAGAASNGQRETREKMTTRRKRIAENLLQSQLNTAHLTTFNEIDMSAITTIRERLKERVEKEQGVKLSFMPFFAKAACLALKAYPIVNAQIDGDSIVYKHYVNLGIAVASDAGLVVPNIKDADSRSIVEIGKDIAAVAKRARDGKLSMDDLTGGTFTITNGGVFGSLVSTPIINYPQVGILGLHKTQDRPVAIDGKVEIRPMMYIALSYDHRVIDGQQAVLFLVRIKELMEDPASMLVF